MIIEDERGLDLPCENGYYDGSGRSREEPVSRDMHDAQFEEFLDRHVRIRNGNTHRQLNEDLIDHLWKIKKRRHNEN